jgi:mono/diheme cytochrome c family protein
VSTRTRRPRATATFSQSCSNCHTLTQDGGKPLTGDAFWKGFTQKTVGDLLTFVKTNMPNGVNAGGRCRRRT